MTHNQLFIAVLILFDGAAVAWAAWELWSLRARNHGSSEPEPQGAGPDLRTVAAS